MPLQNLKADDVETAFTRDTSVSSVMHPMIAPAQITTRNVKFLHTIYW